MSVDTSRVDTSREAVERLAILFNRRGYILLSAVLLELLAERDVLQARLAELYAKVDEVHEAVTRAAQGGGR